MTVYKCDRCGAIYEHNGKSYGYSISQRLYNGATDIINQIDLCPKCEKQLSEFMMQYVTGEKKE